MKKLLFIISFLSLTNQVFCGIDIHVINTKTNTEFSKNDGVRITIVVSLIEREAFRNVTNPRTGETEEIEVSLPDLVNCGSTSIIYDPDLPRLINSRFGVEDLCTHDKGPHATRIDIIVEASGYEPEKRTITYAKWDLDTRPPTVFVFHLIAKQENINLNGNLNIDQQNNKTENLGVMSTSDIAKKLGVTESEIIKLILSNQLKGKKIGEKYFVRKEDFDAFMKK
jgi:excisionase family DNA binding protein